MKVAGMQKFYRKRCKFYEGQTVKTDIVWFEAATDAQWLNMPTVFWPYRQVRQVHNPGGVGEDTRAWPVYLDGSPPVLGLPGDHFEGTPEDFLGKGSLPVGMNEGRYPYGQGCFRKPALGVSGSLYAPLAPSPALLGIGGNTVPCRFPRSGTLGISGGRILYPRQSGTLALVGARTPTPYHRSYLGILGRRCYGPLCTPISSTGGILFSGSSTSWTVPTAISLGGISLGGSSTTSTGTPPVRLLESGGVRLLESGGSRLLE